MYISQGSEIDRNVDIVVNYKSKLKFYEDIKQGNSTPTVSSHVY